jgi:hypothetical protein
VEAAVEALYSGDPGPVRGILAGLGPADTTLSCEVKIKVKEEDVIEEGYCEQGDGGLKEEEESDEVDANDNIDDSEDEDWSTTSPTPETADRKLSVKSASRLGKKRGPYRKRAPRPVGAGPYTLAPRPCQYCGSELRAATRGGIPLSVSGLARHEKQCLREVLASHRCGLCAWEGPARPELLEHLAEHGLAVPALVCTADRCPEVFRHETSRARHQQAEHGDGSGGGPPARLQWNDASVGQEVAECNCGITFESKSDRIVHTRFHHSSLPSFACQFCTKLNIFTSQEVCAEHEQFWHRLWCPETSCSFSCEAEAKLQNHLFRQHKREMPDYMKKKRPALAVEKDKEDDSTLAVCCEVCGKQFGSSQKLAYHMDEHKDQQFNCEQCDKVFQRKLNLQLHMKTIHSGQTFICETCSATFKSRRNLRMHIHHHHLERKLQCQLCPKAFVEAGKLKQHMTNVHIKDTPYKCRYCEKAYNDKSNMRQHERREHENDPTVRRGGRS